MNQPEFENLLQTLHTRDLTDAELAKLEHWLAANPDEQDAWAALDHLLVALPDAPVATNFTAGVLDKVMMKIAEFIKHDLEMRDGIKSALRYPAIVMTITIAVAVLAVVYLLPRFTSLFTETRIELPAMTRFYLGIDHIIQNYYLFILSGIK